MSPVKQVVKAPRCVLVLFVGARAIEGAIKPAGERARWDGELLFRIGFDDADGLDQVCMALARLPSLPPCASMQVVVSDAWLAGVSMPWSAALADGARAGQAARVHLAQAGFSLGTRDVIRSGDGAFGAPRLVLGYPAALLEALTQAAAQVQARLDSVLALSAAAWPLEPGRAPVLAVTDGGAIVLASGRAGCASELTVRRLAAGQPVEQQLATLWQRQCLRDPQLASRQQVRWLDLAAGAAAPAPKAPFIALAMPGPAAAGGSAALRLAATVRPGCNSLDAVPRAASPRAVAPMLVAALLAGAALLHAWQSARAAGEMAARLQPAPASVAPAPSQVDWSRAEKARVPAVNIAIRELNLPIAAILRALEPPRGMRVAVLGVTTAPATAAGQASRVKIVAEARTGAEMARYVAFLAERKPFTGAYLSEHEIDESVPERPYRFTLEASWKD